MLTSISGRIVRTALALALAASPALPVATAQARDEVRTMCVTGVAGNDRLNIRERGYAGAPRIGSIPHDACVTVIGVCDGWCHVEYGGVNGMASARFLRAVGGGSYDDGHGPDSYCVRDVALNDVLNMRSGPGASHRWVGELPPAACGIRLLGPCEGNWCRVGRGRASGWVNMRYLGE